MRVSPRAERSVDETLPAVDADRISLVVRSSLLSGWPLRRARFFGAAGPTDEASPGSEGGAAPWYRFRRLLSLSF